MISEAQALEAILSQTHELDSVELPFLEAQGRIAAESSFAEIPYPVFDQSSMDGYAILAADSKLKTTLRVVGEQAAGQKLDLHVREGEAIRIFTGAPLPEGADAVIMQEDVEVLEQGVIRCLEPVEVNENIRRRGTDITVGQKGVSKGTHLHPGHIAWLAAQGKSSISVIRFPRIAIITTGNELVKAGQTLLPGQIYESNGFMLAALCQNLGASTIEFFHSPDQLEATTQLISEIQHRFDILLFSGGVSVGDYDFVKPALSHQDFVTEFWRVAIKPGKPLIFATKNLESHRCHAFGLPGNPISAWVTFLLFVKPCLKKLAGFSTEECSPKTRPLPLAHAVDNQESRTHYFRANLTSQGLALVGAQASHSLGGLIRATHLLKLPPFSSKQAGEMVEALEII